MLGLESRFRDGALAQLLARRLACPGTRIDVADDVQPLLSFFERCEVTHVETETLTALFAPSADEEREPLQLGNLRLLQRHRRGRRAQIEYERSGLRSARGCPSTGRRRPCITGSGACDGTRSQFWRWCHKFFPGSLDRSRCSPRASRADSFDQRGECVRSRVARDRGSPAVIGIRPLDRWLCVPAFRRVCPYQPGSSVKA